MSGGAGCCRQAAVLAADNQATLLVWGQCWKDDVSDDDGSDGDGDGGMRVMEWCSMCGGGGGGGGVLVGSPEMCGSWCRQTGTGDTCDIVLVPHTPLHHSLSTMAAT